MFAHNPAIARSGGLASLSCNFNAPGKESTEMLAGLTSSEYLDSLYSVA